MEALQPIIIQAVAGAIGGLGVSAAMKQAAMSAVTKIIAGIIGGVAAGQILANVMTDMSGPLIDAVGGLGGGVILTAIVGMVMKGNKA